MTSIHHRRMPSRRTVRLHDVFTPQPPLVYTPPIDINIHILHLSRRPHLLVKRDLAADQLRTSPISHISDRPPPSWSLSCSARRSRTRAPTSSPASSTPEVCRSWSLSALRHLPSPLPDRLLCLPALQKPPLLFCPTALLVYYQSDDVRIIYLHIKLRHRIESLMLPFLIQPQAPPAGIPAALTLLTQSTFTQLRSGSGICAVCEPPAASQLL